MPLDIVIATANMGKLDEFRRILATMPIRLHSPADLALAVEVEESGRSFSENALLKARAFREASGMAALADDSGLCIDALDGAPGVRSARFGGLERSPAAQNQLLLELLVQVPPDERGAEFVCVVGYADPSGAQWTAEGRIRGAIASRARGSHGFGYDPVFLVPEIGKTFGELTADEKDRLSHRGQALAQARSYLERSVGLLE